jgi:hypothetical protein
MVIENVVMLGLVSAMVQLALANWRPEILGFMPKVVPDEGSHRSIATGAKILPYVVALWLTMFQTGTITHRLEVISEMILVLNFGFMIGTQFVMLYFLGDSHPEYNKAIALRVRHLLLGLGLGSILIVWHLGGFLSIVVLVFGLVCGALWSCYVSSYDEKAQQSLMSSI